MQGTFESIMRVFRENPLSSFTAYQIDRMTGTNQSSRCCKLLVKDGQLVVDKFRKGPKGGNCYHLSDQTYLEFFPRDES